MNIEPLKSYLNNNNNHNKTKLISDFLNKDILIKLKNSEYIEGDFFINDRLFFIKKNTLELEYVGNITYIQKDKIGIQINKYRNVCVCPGDYYIFRKQKKITKRDIMEELLDKL